jgi:hypothetical protein
MGCSSSNTNNEITPKPQKSIHDYRFQALKEKFNKFKDIAGNLTQENVYEEYKKHKIKLSELNISEADFVEATLNELAQNELRKGVYEKINVNEYLEVLCEFGISEEDFDKFISSLKPIWKNEIKCLVFKAQINDPLNQFYFNNIKYNSEFSDLNLMNFMTSEKIGELLKAKITGETENESKRLELYKGIADVISNSKNLETVVVGIEARSDDDSDRFTTNGDFFVPIFDAIKSNLGILAFGVLNVGNVSFDLSTNGQKKYADLFKHQNLLLAASTLLNIDSINFDSMIKNIEVNKSLKGYLFISEALKPDMLASFLNIIVRSKYLKGGVIGAVDFVNEKMREEINVIKNKNMNLLALAICDKETVRNI